MTAQAYSLPPFLDGSKNGPYNTSIASSASASVASVFSDAFSQQSDDSINTTLTSQSSSSSDLDSCERYNVPRPRSYESLPKQQPMCVMASELPAHLRQNPRRSSTSSTTQQKCPPTLVRQADRKHNFVDNLVDSSTQIVEAIWPTSSIACRTASGSSGVLPLRTFIQETLRRSRTSFSTLQVALYYLVLIKPHVPRHDFTMEQPNDCHASRALQCGRRMFLAALILASKYLQDRNYSARAWSKISGLHTQEINQNEMTFLLAVKWDLHITEAKYTKWTESVMSHTPSQQPPSAGGAAQMVFEQQCETFKRIILKLNPSLDNLEEALPVTPTKSYARRMHAAVSPRSALAAAQNAEATPCMRSRLPPLATMASSPATAFNTPGRHAPALGMLPTPRLTPNVGGLCTPAASATSATLGRSSMSFAVNQQAQACVERWPTSSESSPTSYFSSRSSCLARSVSNTSSPESMVSDTSRTSRSSSISSASSLLPSAPHAKLDVQARCRSAKLCGDRFGPRPVIASISEDGCSEQGYLSSSPDSYTGTVGKDINEMALDTPTPTDADAARALQQLHTTFDRVQSSYVPASQNPVLSRKRSRSSVDNLQDSVRDLLTNKTPTAGQQPPAWTADLLRQKFGSQSWDRTGPVRPLSRVGGKRSCCSAEAKQELLANIHPALGGIGGPGMWTGILQ